MPLNHSHPLWCFKAQRYRVSVYWANRRQVLIGSLWDVFLHWIVYPIIQLYVVSGLQTSLNAKRALIAYFFFPLPACMNAMHQGHSRTLARSRGQYRNHTSWLCHLILIRVWRQDGASDGLCRCARQSQLFVTSHAFLQIDLIGCRFSPEPPCHRCRLEELLKINSTFLNADRN